MTTFLGGSTQIYGSVSNGSRILVLIHQASAGSSADPVSFRTERLIEANRAFRSQKTDRFVIA